MNAFNAILSCDVDGMCHVRRNASKSIEMGMCLGAVGKRNVLNNFYFPIYFDE